MQKQTPIYDVERSSATEAGWLRGAARQLGPVTLSDRSARTKILIQGTSGHDLLRHLWDLPQLSPGAGTRLRQGYLFCLRPDRHFLSLPAADGASTLATLEEASAEEGDLLTVADLTHGRAELWLAGPEAAELLSHLCGLDFHPDHFPDLSARESSVARTHQLILRHDQEGQPTYALIGARSFGAYLWEVIGDSHQP